MKKCMAVLCALFLVFLAASASAEPGVSNLYAPKTPETLRAVLGGKTFCAAVTGYDSTGEDEDAKFTLSVTVYERDRFDASVIENLAAGDILSFGNGKAMMVTEVVRDEYGATVTGGGDDVYCFYRMEDGDYIVSTDTDYPVWTEIFSVKVPLEKDILFLDWSDPENLGDPVKLGFDELLSHLIEGTFFDPSNTTLTFDEDGKLVEFLYSYTPWN